MDILHASTDPDLLTRLKEMLGSANRADIAVGYFFMSGFGAVADELSRLNKTRSLGRTHRPAHPGGCRCRLATGQTPRGTSERRKDRPPADSARQRQLAPQPAYPAASPPWHRRTRTRRLSNGSRDW